MFVPFGFSTRRHATVPSLSASGDLAREMDRVLAALAPAPRGRSSAFEDQEDKLVFTMAVPGFRQEDLEITLDQDCLSVRGERQEPLMEGYEPVHRERGKLSFHQRYELPCRVLSDNVSAKLDSGLLRLELTKSGDEAPRTIQIRTSEDN